MHCQICKKNEATIHLTEITEGTRTELHLCEFCAQEQGVTVKSQIPINELLSSLLSVQPSDDELFGHSEKQKACPNCGFTLDQLREESVLGCPKDYEVFENLLLPIIEKAHDGRTTHCGKIPEKMPENIRKQTEIQALRQQLETAVKNEDYELAAELRDKIASIE